MKNVDMKVNGNILTITVDLTKEFGPSSSGKSIVIASTEGNVSIPERDEKVGLIKVRLCRPFSVRHFMGALPRSVRAIARLSP